MSDIEINIANDNNCRTRDSSLGTSFLHEMIEGSFWKDVLYEIIGKMDPWDIDIAELATEYAKRVEDMTEMNFKVPANVVIVTAVLLRMKADIIGNIPISMEEFMPEFLDEEFNLFGEFDPDAFSAVGGQLKKEIIGDDELQIMMKPKRVVKRRVTAVDLINAIQDVLEEKRLKQKLKKESNGNGNGKKEMEIVLTTNIRQLINETYQRVMEILSTNDVALFSEMAHDLDEKISVFLSLLYLSNNQKLRLEQENLYDEIFIRGT